jgi:ribosome-binding protein aMBF1 (putative translation factor)
MSTVAAPKPPQRGEGDAMPRHPPSGLDADAPDLVGARIKRRRLEVGLTQAALGQLIGRSRSLIAEYEAGRKCIPHPTLWRIARVLGIGLDALFEDRDEQRK